jgi:cytochrome b pre-mRNA-processing protein 3
MKSLFRKAFAPEIPREKVGALYGSLMAAARTPAFFEKLGLADTFENRFELLVLHMFLVLNRLKPEGSASRDIMRGLTEYMIDDIDRTFREMGVGDVGVAKRMKKVVSAFYGRVLAYEKAFQSQDEKDILRALDRNVFAEMDTDIPRLTAMREYMLQQRAALAKQPLEAFNEGTASFAPCRL